MIDGQLVDSKPQEENSLSQQSYKGMAAIFPVMNKAAVNRRSVVVTTIFLQWLITRPLL